MRRFMIFTILAVLVTVFLISAPSSAITYQEGVRAAKSENKPLYLYFYSDG